MKKKTKKQKQLFKFQQDMAILIAKQIKHSDVVMFGIPSGYGKPQIMTRVAELLNDPTFF